jgi:dephospho-CoA kinase
MLYNQKKGSNTLDTAKLIVGLGGMPGSGKSLVVEVAKELGYSVVTMGDVVREQTLLRGLEPTPQNVGKVMLELRAQEGNYVIAKKCIPKILGQPTNRVLIDGLRSLYEADIFKDNFSRFVLVAVHSPPQTRFERLKHRGRSDDPQTYDVFHQRDMRELGVGLGGVIGLAEKIIVNDDGIEGFKASVRENFERIETQWLK